MVSLRSCVVVVGLTTCCWASLVHARWLAPLYPSYAAIDAQYYEIPNEYIVVFHSSLSHHTVQDHTGSFLFELMEDSNSSFVRHMFDMDGFRGYSGEFDQDTLERIRSSEDVAYVEKNQRMAISEVQVMSGLCKVRLLILY
jgi:hypothetical protein